MTDTKPFQANTAGKNSGFLFCVRRDKTGKGIPARKDTNEKGRKVTIMQTYSGKLNNQDCTPFIKRR